MVQRAGGWGVGEQAAPCARIWDQKASVRCTPVLEVLGDIWVSLRFGLAGAPAEEGAEGGWSLAVEVPW